MKLPIKIHELLSLLTHNINMKLKGQLVVQVSAEVFIVINYLHGLVLYADRRDSGGFFPKSSISFV